MAVARHGRGPRASLGALASQVHPVFMLPPLAAAMLGAILAGRLTPAGSGLHLLAVFLAVYTAHVKDGFVDFHRRGEDDDHPMTIRGCRLALLGATVGFFLATAGVAVVAGPVPALLTLPGWLIGVLHAPQLDTNPVGATLGYPTGVALALLGGYSVAAGSLALEPLAFAAVILVALTGVKIVDDASDVTYDASIGKHTVAVVLGETRARALANGLFVVAVVTTIALSIEGVFPPVAPLGAFAFGAIALVAARAPPTLATELLVRGAYLYLAVLVTAVWFGPLAGLPLPDVGVFGPYTYLATELVFGAAAGILLHRTGSWWSAARTVAVLYPVAYVWDWYTLEVGVFDVVLRTGIEFAGIPLEEHLFMVVVPAFVVGVHETLRAGDGA